MIPTIVGTGITILVYGGVAIIVKADDLGLVLARSGIDGSLGGLIRWIGRGLVTGMPYFLKCLSVFGTAAMIWVGGGILVHGVATFGWHAPEQGIEALATGAAAGLGGASGLTHFLVVALGSGIAGLAVGALLIPVTQKAVVPFTQWVLRRFKPA